jgi:hypothetical protein
MRLCKYSVVIALIAINQVLSAAALTRRADPWPGSRENPIDCRFLLDPTAPRNPPCVQPNVDPRYVDVRPRSEVHSTNCCRLGIIPSPPRDGHLPWFNTYPSEKEALVLRRPM